MIMAALRGGPLPASLGTAAIALGTGLRPKPSAAPECATRALLRPLRAYLPKSHEAVHGSPDLAPGQVVDHVPLAWKDGQRALRGFPVQPAGMVAGIDASP